MKIKEIYDEIKSIVDICQKKVKYAEENKLPEKDVEYERGRLYESAYILEIVEKIIFE